MGHKEIGSEKKKKEGGFNGEQASTRVSGERGRGKTISKQIPKENGKAKEPRLRRNLTGKKRAD